MIPPATLVAMPRAQAPSAIVALLSLLPLAKAPSQLMVVWLSLAVALSLPMLWMWYRAVDSKPPLKMVRMVPQRLLL